MTSTLQRRCHQSAKCKKRGSLAIDPKECKAKAKKPKKADAQAANNDSMGAVRR